MSSYNSPYCSVSVLVGKSLSSVKSTIDEILFETTTGEIYVMYHEQYCCESVCIESIVGDLRDLIGNPILVAEESSNSDSGASEYDDSYTWTFYKFATVRGWVDIRWYGTSNGNYSESVDFKQIK